MGKAPSLVYSDRTDIGRRRANNQDSKAVLPAHGQQQRARGWLFLVADGMGAHAAGELASAIAADRVPKIYDEQSHYSPPLALRNSIEQANGEIFTKGESGFEHKGMGFAIHYRLTPSAGEAVASAARSVARRRGLRVLTRTDHVEIRPPVDGDKGSALRKLVASRGIRGLVVMGDDPVDIPAFDAGRAHAESTGARVQLVGVGGRLDSVSLDLRLHDVADACTLLGAVADGLAA